TRILASREAGTPLRRQAVLFRSGSHSDMLEVELAKRKIPFVKFGGLKFLEAAHVKDLLSILRWAENPADAIAGFRVVQLLPGCGPAFARRAVDAGLDRVEPPKPARPLWPALCELYGELRDAPWPAQVGRARRFYDPIL